MAEDAHFAEISKKDAEFAERLLHSFEELLKSHDNALKGLKRKTRVLLARNIELKKRVEQLERMLELENDA